MNEREALIARLSLELPKVGEKESVWCSVQGRDLRAAVEALAQTATEPLALRLSEGLGCDEENYANK